MRAREEIERAREEEQAASPCRLVCRLFVWRDNTGIRIG